MAGSEVYGTPERPRHLYQPIGGLAIVLRGDAGDALGTWKYDAASGWWVDEHGQALTLDEVQEAVKTAVRRTPDDR